LSYPYGREKVIIIIVVSIKIRNQGLTMIHFFLLAHPKKIGDVVQALDLYGLAQTQSPD
jgi:hypothetical protein